MEWQPIETAPRDGTCVLLCLDQADKWSGMYVGYWSSTWEEWKFHVEGFVRSAKYWQPLPSPPDLDRKD